MWPEIPPAVKECPVCDPQFDVSTAVSDPVVARVLPSAAAQVTDRVVATQTPVAASISNPLSVPPVVAGEDVAPSVAPVDAAKPLTRDPMLRLVLRVRPPVAPIPSIPPQLPGLGELAAAIDSAHKRVTLKPPPDAPPAEWRSVAPLGRTTPQLAGGSGALALLAPPKPEASVAAPVLAASSASEITTTALATPTPEQLAAVELAPPVPEQAESEPHPELKTAFASAAEEVAPFSPGRVEPEAQSETADCAPLAHAGAEQETVSVSPSVEATELILAPVDREPDPKLFLSPPR